MFKLSLMFKSIKIFKVNIKSTIGRYYLFTFFHSLFFISAVLVPFLTKWGGISLAKAQLLQSWFMFWLFVLEIPTGAVADYIGRKHSIALGAFVATLGALTYGSIPNFKIFLLGEFLFALSGALISGANEALLYDSLKEVGREAESKKIFGQADAFRLLGIFVSAPIGSLIAAKISINAAMQLSTIPFLLAAIIGWSIKEPQVGRNQSESKRYLEIIKEGVSFLKNHPIVKLYAFDAVAIASTAYFIIWYYQPLLERVGIPILYFGLFHSLLTLSEIVISLNFTRLEKMTGSYKKLIRTTALITAVSLILVAIRPNLLTITLLIIFGGGFGLTRITLISSHLNKYIPSEQRATILSSISMFRRFSLTILNPLVGFMADKSLNLALFVLGLASFSVFLFSPINKLKEE